MLRLDDEDDDFSLPQPSSRLATLFSQDNQPVTDDSFKYKAPKDPSQKSLANETSKKAKAPPKTTLLCAYSGHCYKLVNGQYSDGQKLGVAIIGEVHNNLYSILLYITKEKPISFTRITPSTSVEVGSRNFVSFTDDSCQFWSVGFTKEEEVVGFTKQVAMARWMSGTGDKVLKQDLLMGDGCEVGLGDLVEIKVKCFRLVTEGVLILDPVREDIVKFKIGKKTIPQIWEETVVGMKKLGQRLLMYCDEESQLIHNSGDNSLEAKVEEITLVRVKFAKGKEVPKSDSPIALPEVRAVHQMDEGDSSPYSRSTQMHLEESQPASRSTNQERVVLMNRIKKLGQPMLPIPKVLGFVKQSGNRDEEEEEEEDIQMSRPSSRSAGRPSPDFSEGRDGEVVVREDLSQMLIKPDIRPKPNQITRVIQDPRRSYPIQEYQLQRPAPSFTTFSPFMANPTITHAQSPDPGISLMMIDMKQQNLDLRSLLMRASDKIDALGAKVDDIQKSCLHHSAQQQQQQQYQQQQQLATSSSSSSFLSPLLQCEVNVISQSIDKIFKDNELLRREVRDREIKIGNLTQRVNEVSDNNQRLIQKSFDENTSSIVSVKILSEENAALKTSLEEANSQLAQNKQELSAMKLMLQTRSDEVKEANMLLDEMRVKLTAKQDHLGEIEARIGEERSKGELELEKLKKLLAEKDNQLAREREEFNFIEQDKKTMIIEYDRIISDLRETLMRRNSLESDTKVVVKELEKEFLERLATQEEFHRAMAKNWEEEKAGLVEKLSGDDKAHQDKLNEVVALKNKETQVIKEELKKLSHEYNLIKTMAKDLKEKYDLIFEQHKNYTEENDSKVKGLMNNIYRCFREGFATDKSYGGAHVLSYASKVIRSKTLEMMSNNNANQNNINHVIPSASSSSSLLSLSGNADGDTKLKTDVLTAVATTATTYSTASTLVMPSLESDARNDADSDTVQARFFEESKDVEPDSQNEGGALSEIGSQNEVNNQNDQDEDPGDRIFQAQTENKLNLDAACLNLKSPKAGEKLTEDSACRMSENNKEVELRHDECSAEDHHEETVCDSLAVNFSLNSLSKESCLATQSTNDEEQNLPEQPMKCEDEISPANESKRVVPIEDSLQGSECLQINQSKSITPNNEEDDNEEPVSQILKRTLIVNTGERVVLSCNFSEQADKMRWYFGSIIIYDSSLGSNGHLESVCHLEQKMCKIWIQEIKKEQAGIYKFECGKAGMTMNLACQYEIVVGDLECNSSIRANHLMIGESDSPMKPDILKRFCAFIYSDPIEFVWMKQHNSGPIWRDKVLNGTSIIHEGNENILKAEDQMQVSREMDGVIYECYLKEINDIKPCSLPKISVQSVKNISQKSDPVYSSDIRSISCAVNKTLAIGCTYSWTIRKRNIVWKLEGIQNLTRDHLTESGYYECIASCHFVTGGVYSFRGTHFDFVDDSVADGDDCKRCRGFKVSTIILGLIVAVFVVAMGIFFIRQFIIKRMQPRQQEPLRSINLD